MNEWMNLEKTPISSNNSPDRTVALNPALNTALINKINWIKSDTQTICCLVCRRTAVEWWVRLDWVTLVRVKNCSAEYQRPLPSRGLTSMKPSLWPLNSRFTYLLAVLFIFLPARRYARAGNSDRNVSVRLSRAGIVSKRRKLASWFLHHLVAPRL